MTDSEVAVRDGASVEQSFQLRDVRSVTIESHRARNFAIGFGLATFGAVTLLSCGSGDEEDCWPEFGALFGGIAAGAGALTGALADRRSLPARTLFPKSGMTLTVAPMIAPRRVGVGFVARW